MRLSTLLGRRPLTLQGAIVGGGATLKNAPTYVGIGSAAGSYAFAVTGTLAPTMPTVAAGDLLIAAVMVLSQADTIATPDGWSLVAGPDDSHAANAVRGYLFTRTASGGDTVTFTKTGTAGAWRGIVLAVRGGGTVTSATPGVSSGLSEPVLPSVTPTAPNSFLVGIAGHRVTSGAQATAPTGYTERADSASVNTPNFVVNTATRLPASATGTVAIDISGSGSGWVAYHIAVAPA